jgi:hypothetical protein
MARIKYQVSAFSQELAKAYSLVAMVKTDVTPTSVLYNIDEQGVANPKFKGAGIAKYKSSSGRFEFWYDGKTYLFSTSGESSDSPSAGYRLMMAKVIENVNPSGNSVIGTNTGSATRNSDGSITPGGITYDNRPILIDSQNARDQFATEILNSILQKLDVDPANLDSSTRSHYCQVAYDWAANMMTAAANARGTLTDETESSASARQEAIGSLESNTDKLLNNLIVALERTDEVKTEAGKEVYSKKVTLPDIQGLLDKMDVLNTSITALKDNVTNAMTNMQSVMTQQVAAYNQVATQLGLINSSLQGFTQNVNTRLANIDQGVSAARTDVSGVQNGVNTANTTLTTVNSTTGIIKNNLDSVKSDVAIIKQNTTPV